MKGLILYEFYKIKSAYLKNLLLVAVMYVALPICLNTESLLYVLVWMMGFYTIGGLALDESWNRFARSLPVSPAQMAGAKFIVAGFMVLLGMAHSLLTGSVLHLLRGIEYVDFLLSLLAIGIMSMATTAIMLPCAAKWGVEKARNTMILVFAALFGIGLVAVKALNLSGLTALIQRFDALILPLLIIALAAAIAISWLAMKNIYASKEV